MASIVSIEDARLARSRQSGAGRRRTYFSRHELQQLLDMYSRRVMSGEWRDYAIDHEPRQATFSVFRHTADRPEYAIVKLSGSGGNRDRSLFVLRDATRRLKQSSSLADVIAALDKRLTVVWTNG